MNEKQAAYSSSFIVPTSYFCQDQMPGIVAEQEGQLPVGVTFIRRIW
jgi:hypothetical protein